MQIFLLNEFDNCKVFDLNPLEKTKYIQSEFRRYVIEPDKTVKKVLKIKLLVEFSSFSLLAFSSKRASKSSTLVQLHRLPISVKPGAIKYCIPIKGNTLYLGNDILYIEIFNVG